MPDQGTDSSGAKAGDKRRRSEDGGGGGALKPEGGDGTTTDDPPLEFLQATAFARKVYSRFEALPHIFEAFIVVLLSWRAGRKSLTEVHDELSLLFRGEPDLLEELESDFLSSRLCGSAIRVPRPDAGGSQRAPDHFQARLPPTQNHQGPGSSGGNATQQQQQHPHISKTRDFLAHVRSMLPSDSNAYNDFLKLMQMFGDGILTLEQLRRIVDDTYPDAASSCNLFFDHCYARSALDDSDEEDAEDPQLEAAGQLGVYLNNPVASLDLEGWEACPPSYRRIPSNYPFLESRHKTTSKIAAAVLNGSWVADTCGHEDNKFKKNQCQEALYDVEDDEYELEILLQSAQSALRSLEPLSGRIGAMGDEEKAVLRLVRADLPPSVIRVVRTLYLDQLDNSDQPEQGQTDMLQLLLACPAAAVPVLVARLREVIRQWQQLLQEMKPAWQQITDNNYERSLDYGSGRQQQQQQQQGGARARSASAQPAAADE